MPINLKPPALALLLASTGCVAPPIDDPDVEERVDGAHEALTQPAGGDASPSLADLPRWKVFLRGTDTYRGTTRADYGKEHYFDDPRDADRSGELVAVRAGDEGHPEKYVSFSLAAHWKMGDRYFASLRERGAVSATNLLVITSELLKSGGELSPVPPLAGGEPAKRYAGAFEEPGDGPSWMPWPPLPGGDHTGGSGGAPGTGSAPGPAQRPGWGPGVTPPQGHPHHRPPAPTAAEREAWEAARYGVDRGDPSPRPFPGDEGFVPALGEQKETFKCEGEVFRGFRRGCADFQAKATGAKWGEKLSGWEGRYFSANNIAMTHEDWTTVCKVMSTIAYTTGCAAIYFSCAAGTYFTVGTLAIPCAALIFVACTAGGAAETVLFDRCGTLMKMH